MLSRRLKRRGYYVVVSPDGKAGIEVALSIQPHLILLDLNLPVIDGWTVTKELKSNSITADIPIIAVSSHALASEQAAAFNAGCDDYETKPISFERLLGKIERLLSTRVSN